MDTCGATTLFRLRLSFVSTILVHYWPREGHGASNLVRFWLLWCGDFVAVVERFSAAAAMEFVTVEL